MALFHGHMQKCLPSLTDTAAAFRKRALLRDSSILKQAASNTAVPLSKCLGLSDLVLATIGSTIGAGIFVVTGVAAREDAGYAMFPRQPNIWLCLRQRPFGSL